MHKVMKTDSEWLAELGDLAFQVTRRAATERPFSHPGFPKGPGTYRCVCCDAPLFDASTKFESGCGWPKGRRISSGRKSCGICAFARPVGWTALEGAMRTPTTICASMC